MFNRNTMVVLNPKNPGTGREWKSDSATFDWKQWAEKSSTNQALYGSMPDVSTEEHRLLMEENKVARIPNAPSVEIDSFSWSRYASAVYTRDWPKSPPLRRHSLISTALPSRRSRTTETGTNESLSCEPKTKRRRSK
ncbi:hypothetical protein V8E55_004938 [Tylopilus felleus]